MKGKNAVFPALMLALCVALSSCTGPYPQGAGKNSYPVPEEYLFKVSYEAAWNGSLRALSEEESLQTKERDSGLMSTGYRDINHKVQALNAYPLLGRVYKNAYVLHLQEIGAGQTRISIRSKLLLENLTGHASQLDDLGLEAYMRQEMFRRICFNLYKDGSQCPGLFPDYHQVSVSCSAPPSLHSDLESKMQQTGASDTAAKAKRVSVKQVQQALVASGYQPGAVDGRLGPKTRAALRHLQEDKGLEGTGEVDWLTMQALGF